MTKSKIVGEHTWRLCPYSEAKKEHLKHSAVFEMGGYKWRLTLKPRGCSSSRNSLQAIYLTCIGLARISMDAWPRTKIRFSAINVKQPHLSLSMDAVHTFNMQDPNWGIVKFLAIRPNGDPIEEGFLLNNTIQYKVEIEIKTHNTQKPMNSLRLARPLDPTAVLKIRLDRELFIISVQSLERFPDSLLYSMVQEFPELLDEGQELKIDRRLDTFSVIYNVYTGGDYFSKVDYIELEDIQMELDYFQLPSVLRLGMRTLPIRKVFCCAVYGDIESLLDEIREEVRQCRIGFGRPLSVLVYYKVNLSSDGSEGERRVCIIPSKNSRPGSLIGRRGHSDFAQVLAKGSQWSRTTSLGLELSRPGSHQKFIIMQFGYGSRLRFLNEFAEKRGGRRFQRHRLDFGEEGSKLSVEVLSVGHSVL